MNGAPVVGLVGFVVPVIPGIPLLLAGLALLACEYCVGEAVAGAGAGVVAAGSVEEGLSSPGEKGLGLLD